MFKMLSLPEWQVCSKQGKLLFGIKMQDMILGILILTLIATIIVTFFLAAIYVALRLRNNEEVYFEDIEDYERGTNQAEG